MGGGIRTLIKKIFFFLFNKKNFSLALLGFKELQERVFQKVYFHVLGKWVITRCRRNLSQLVQYTFQEEDFIYKLSKTSIDHFIIIIIIIIILVSQISVSRCPSGLSWLCSLQVWRSTELQQRISWMEIRVCSREDTTASIVHQTLVLILRICQPFAPIFPQFSSQIIHQGRTGDIQVQIIIERYHMISHITIRFLKYFLQYNFPHHNTIFKIFSPIQFLTSQYDF